VWRKKWQIRRARAFEYTAHISGGAPKQIGVVGSMAASSFEIDRAECSVFGERGRSLPNYQVTIGERPGRPKREYPIVI
jgi:hypothetical protein